jgi:hypothetical protein
MAKKNPKTSLHWLIWSHTIFEQIENPQPTYYIKDPASFSDNQIEQDPMGVGNRHCCGHWTMYGYVWLMGNCESWIGLCFEKSEPSSTDALVMLGWWSIFNSNE